MAIFTQMTNAYSLCPNAYFQRVGMYSTDIPPTWVK